MIYGTQYLSLPAPKVWEILTNEIKDSETQKLPEFLKSKKKWLSVYCPCKLCKTYAAGRINLSSWSHRGSYVEIISGKLTSTRFLLSVCKTLSTPWFCIMNYCFKQLQKELKITKEKTTKIIFKQKSSNKKRRNKNSFNI